MSNEMRSTAMTCCAMHNQRIRASYQQAIEPLIKMRCDSDRPIRIIYSQDFKPLRKIYTPANQRLLDSIDRQLRYIKDQYEEMLRHNHP